MEVYKEQKLKVASFFQKLLKTQPKGNAIIEINNLFAKANSIKDISIDSVQTVAYNYKVNFNKKFKDELYKFYAQYLQYCFKDHTLSDAEIAELQHLKCLLNLNDKDTKQIYDETVKSIYKAEIDKIVSDGRLDPEEKEFLNKLQSNLALSDDVTNSIYKESATSVLTKFLEGAVSDQRLSPGEEKEIDAIAKSLGINLSYDSNTKQVIEKYKLFWSIENGDLPLVNADIILQKNETCHFKTNVDWVEQRKVTKRINYGGPTLRIKIAKGVYWRTGSMGVQRITEDVWQVIDTGNLYLTNKRIIFNGNKANKTIALKKIIDFEVFSNGVNIDKDSGKSPFLQFNSNTDIFSMIIGKLLYNEID